MNSRKAGLGEEQRVIPLSGKFIHPTRRVQGPVWGGYREERGIEPILEDLKEAGREATTRKKLTFHGTSCLTHSVSLTLSSCESLQQCLRIGINTHFTDEETELQRATAPCTRVPVPFC